LPFPLKLRIINLLTIFAERSAVLVHLFHPGRIRQDQRTWMLETPVEHLIVRLAVPTTVSMLITSIYNMADTYFVSQISTSASGAVGIVFSIMGMIQAIGFMIGVGSGSISSRLLGQNKKEEAGRYASSAIAMAVVMGLLFSTVCLLNLKGLIWWLGSTATIYPHAVDYAFFILLGAPVMVVSFTLNNLLRWQGKARLAVIGLTTGGVLNIILDPLFIFGFHMGTQGASLATFLSQCVGVSILASFFLKGQSDIPVSWGRISRTWKIYGEILRQGLPSFFRNSMMSVSTMVLNYNARIYGDAAVAAMSIVTKVFNFLQSVVIGFGQGLQPVVGYNYGAGKLGRVKRGILFGIKTYTCLLTVIAAAGYLTAPWVVQIFRDDPDVIVIGVQAFRYQCMVLPLMPVFVFSNMIFQGMGKPLHATTLAVCRPCFSIVLVTALCQLLGLNGLEIAQPLSDVLSFLMSAALLLRLMGGELRGAKED